MKEQQTKLQAWKVYFYDMDKPTKKYSVEVYAPNLFTAKKKAYKIIKKKVPAAQFWKYEKENTNIEEVKMENYKEKLNRVHNVICKEANDDILIYVGKNISAGVAMLKKAGISSKVAPTESGYVIVSQKDASKAATLAKKFTEKESVSKLNTLHESICKEAKKLDKAALYRFAVNVLGNSPTNFNMAQIKKDIDSGKITTMDQLLDMGESFKEAMLPEIKNLIKKLRQDLKKYGRVTPTNDGRSYINLIGKIPNELRVRIIKKIMPDAKINDWKDVSYGNVRDSYIALNPKQWIKFMGYNESQFKESLKESDVTATINGKKIILTVSGSGNKGSDDDGNMYVKVNGKWQRESLTPEAAK